MRKKLRSRRGFSLTETLICVVLLALMTAAGTTVSASVLSTRNDMMAVADAQVLASTVLESVANEIRYGENIQVDETNKTVTFTSTNFGEETTFGLDTNHHVTVTSKSITSTLTDDFKKLISEKAYTMGLKVEKLEFEKDGDSIKITVTVTGAGSTWEKSLTVTPLNTPKTT